ncbi:hypothetical protein Tco_1282675 [Tanacetum coccineum]
MTDSRPVMEQYNELLGILGRFTQHKMNMDEAIQVSCIIDKLPPSWKDFKHTLKHKKEELTLVELGSHLRIKESLRHELLKHLYTVSIKEDTTYMCLYFTRNQDELKRNTPYLEDSIRRIKDLVLKDSGRY